MAEAYMKRAKGVEPSANVEISPEKQHVLDPGGVKAALDKLSAGGLDTDLAAVVEAWPDLPVDVRKMIAGVVRLTPKIDDRATRR
jgi:hypothetical protein